MNNLDRRICVAPMMDWTDAAEMRDSARSYEGREARSLFGSTEFGDFDSVGIVRIWLIAIPRWASGLNKLKRGSPGKARKAGVVPVGCDPFTAGLDSQSRKPCVLGEVAGGFSLRTHFFEDRPMAITGFGDRRIRLLEKRSAEIEDVASRAGISVDSMVSCNPDYARQYLRRDPVGGRSVHNRLQPFLVLRVIL
jgi:hypothetical protein